MVFNDELWQILAVRRKVILTMVENSVYNDKRRLWVEQALWRPPEHPWVKLNTDRSWLSETSAMGMGGVIRDWADMWRGAFRVETYLVMRYVQSCWPWRKAFRFVGKVGLGR